MRMNYSKNGLTFESSDIQEALLKNEAFQCESIQDRNLSWHHLLVHNSTTPVKDLRACSVLENWGMDPSNGSDRVEEVLASKRKSYQWDVTSIEEAKNTSQYERALQLVQDQFGKPFKDGSSLFSYQIETAALMIAKRRLLLALDMGLGKTRTTLVGLLADPSNRKVLIITMSRNINDWIKEIKLLGFEDQYIVLASPADMQSEKRIHVVSYERWSADRVNFEHKPLSECPSCKTTHHSLWKAHLGYCKVCKQKQPKFQEGVRWSEEDLPKKCPKCHHDWKGHYACTECDYSIVESRKKALHSYFHHGYQATAVDEAHYIKNGQSKRSLSVQHAKTEKRFGLTGTPAENGTEDLYWLLGWLTGFTSRYEDPIDRVPFRGFGKKGQEHFRDHYGGGKKRRVLDIDSIQARASNHEELWKVLDAIMIRKRKTDPDVQKMIEVPAPVHHRVHLELHEVERELYDQIMEDFRQWYELELAKKEAAEARGDTYRISTISICAWMDKLRKAASSPWQFETYDVAKAKGTTAKLEYVRNKARDLIRRGKKILIFSGHRETVEQLALLLDGILPGKEAGYIHGAVKMDYRFDLMNRFQNPNDPMSILIMSHRTGAESYTLTEGKAVFLFDLDFNPMVRPEVA
jgi:SNF2 family DNA or RNA helicase